MKITTTFSGKRFMMLFRQSLLINKKFIFISMAAVAGIIFVLLVLLQYSVAFRNWHHRGYFITFLVFYFILGAVYSGLSFPAFRSKVKTVDYLMLPASALEKFLYEFITRIIVFIIFMPLIYWIVANIEGAIVHYYEPKMVNYHFSFHKGWYEFFNKQNINGWVKLLLSQIGLFILIAPFTGSTHFSKSPLIKTIFAFSIIAGVFSLYLYILIKILNIKNYYYGNSGVLFVHNNDQFATFFGLSMAVVNISLLAVSWFRLKEKEA
jgi:hypothetical protein